MIPTSIVRLAISSQRGSVQSGLLLTFFPKLTFHFFFYPKSEVCVVKREIKNGS
jgi:hypothetical protein